GRAAARGRAGLSGRDAAGGGAARRTRRAGARARGADHRRAAGAQGCARLPPAERDPAGADPALHQFRGGLASGLSLAGDRTDTRVRAVHGPGSGGVVSTAVKTAAEGGALVRPGRQRKLLTIGLMLAMGIAALEGTVVVTALPTIVGELQGIALYPWVFSVYLLTSTTSVPIYGKLADVYGRKPVFLVGLGLFLAGTLASGLAASMTQLIAFRAAQGLGAGAVLPLTFTVLGDIYALRERARVQALFSSVWGVLSLVGP